MGQTQNVNDLLNEIIWQKYLNNFLVSRQALEAGLSSPVLPYNHRPCNISSKECHWNSAYLCIAGLLVKTSSKSDQIL